LNELDNKITPLEKLASIEKCLMVITQAIEVFSAENQGKPCGDVFGVLIYVIVKSAPKRIHTNLK